MNVQNQIKRTLSQPLNLECVVDILAQNRSFHRSELARVLCKRFDFFDARGQAQLGGCLKALRELEASGHFVLPAAQAITGPKSPRRLPEPVPPPKEVPPQVGGVEGLALTVVSTLEQMRIWNELMITEHPRGAGPFVGRQLRYLIGSKHGWLGGVGFASAALQLADRDEWIGWDVSQRRQHLEGVLGMCRFLIRPSVHCHNLASKVLKMTLERVPEDFQRLYHYRPLLVETFVDTLHHSGACYRAANWIKVGQTQGRGRQDRFRQSSESRKDIFVYPIDPEFRTLMGLAEDAGGGALEPAEGLDKEHWAHKEFGGAPLGDARLSKRLVKMAHTQAEEPWRAFSGVAQGDWSQTKGYYRFIDMAEPSAVNMANILEPHQKRTVRRMKAQRTVLCIQDGSDLNFNHLATCEGLGQIGTNQTGATSRGLHLHSTLAVATNGVPLGVVQAQCIAAQPKSKQDKRKSSAIPIEEKKTFVWIEHHSNLENLSTEMPHTKLVDVCDREADFFEMFDHQRKKNCVDILVRAKVDRKITEEPFKLHEGVRQAPVQSRVRIHIPRQSARPKRSKQKARPKRPGRMADLAVRYAQVEWIPPRYNAKKKPIEIWILHAFEENPPENTQPVEWFLLTTIDITSAAEAEQCLRWYCLRWRIEDWHRVLKTGCRIENMAHETAERLRRAIAINLVIAWRIMLMTLLNRETPDLPAEVLFSDIELRTLHAYAKKKRLKPPLLLTEAVRMVAKIGGYLGRNNDPPPGHQLIWQGYSELQYMAMGFALMEEEIGPAPPMGKGQP